MTKEEYLRRLSSLLSCLGEAQRAETLAFYEEMILDRMEDGLTEEEAVATLDPPGVVAEAILDDLPAVPRAVVKTRRKSPVLLWLLVILGSPVWLALLAAFAITVLALYAVIWIFVAVLWGIAVMLVLGCPVFLSLGACGAMIGNIAFALVQAGAALMTLGLGLIGVRLAFAVTKWVALLSRALVMKALSPFVKRRGTGSDGGSHGGDPGAHAGTGGFRATHGSDDRPRGHRPIAPDELKQFA